MENGESLSYKQKAGSVTVDFKIVQLVETLTRKSTEEGVPPALKHYAQHLGIAERNMYKLVRKAKSEGFKFGVSINYDRIDLRLAVTVTDRPVVADVPPKSSAKLLDGQYVQTFYVPITCLDNFAGGVEASDLYFAVIVWGSRPALASIPYTYATLDIEPRRDIVEGMRRVFREVYERSFPDISGRKYPADKVTLLLLSEANRDALRSIASISRDYNLSLIKTQRKYYRLWRRKAILGYRIKCAPYCESTGIIAVIRHHDPERLAYSLPVLPPIASAAVAYPYGEQRPVVIAQTMGGGSMTHVVMRLVREMGATIEKLYPYTSLKIAKRTELEKAYKAPIGTPIDCPRVLI